MGPLALLLDGDPHAPDARQLKAMLDFFEIPWHSVCAEQIRDGSAAALVQGHTRYAVLASAEALALIPRSDRGLLSAAASVYIYGWKPTPACRALLRELSGDAEAEIRTLKAQPLSVSITDDSESMCGPLSGMTIQLEPGAAETVLTLRTDLPGFQAIASAPEGYLFAGLDEAGVRFFLDASPQVLHLHQLATSHFDVKKSFSGAVAIVLYLKHAFHDIWWHAPELNACLILDDLLLKERHGYFQYKELLRLIDRYRIAATVAFIPWNWRRREQKVVEAIRCNADRLSVCIHGCDHCPDEFAIRSIAWLDARVKTGQQRMRRLLAETGIHHDQVQVFPQGKFCPEAGAALKQNGLTAAVNTEPAPLDHELNCTTIADQWSMANLRYGGFPIFSRRTIRCGVENFAFDGVLGKPCLIAGHHDLFHSESGELVGFLEKLHSLKWKLTWRTIENAVCRSYKIRQSGGTTMVKMHGERLILENSTDAAKDFTVLKKIGDPAGFEGVTADGHLCGYEYADGQIRFTVHVAPRSEISVKCAYAGEMSSPAPDPMAYRLKIALLRHLSVLRDTWISKSGLMSQSTLLAMRALNQLGARKRQAVL